MNHPEIKRLNIEKNEQLKLKNDGRLAFFWVGIGSAFSKQLYQTNLLIIKGNDHLLVDCGSRCPTAFVEYGCPITNIRNYLITHSHADHIGGLEEVALINRYLIKSKPKMIVTDEYEKILWEFSLKGGCAFNERHEGKNLEIDDFFDIIKPEIVTKTPRPIFSARLGSIDLKLFRTMHIPDNSKSWKEAALSYGIIVDEKIIFTADTKHDPDLINNLLIEYSGINYIFHDCQFFSGGVHTSYKELLTYPEEIRNKMYLTHYGDNYNDFNPENDGFKGFTKQGHYYYLD